MADKKYQVFISSTYSDLKEERRKILDTLLMADCIPSGMEAFVATDNEQFEVIKKVIDLCDYYVLIIGKRYGSISSVTGKSYTEMEYDYAKSKEIPILVFAIDPSAPLDESKTETDENKKKLLEEFRLKALNSRLATIWRTPEDLTTSLAVSIMKAKYEIPRAGWQRATDYDEAALRRDIMNLQQDKLKLETNNRELKKSLSELTQSNDIAFEGLSIEIEYHYYWPPSGNNKQRVLNKKNVDLAYLFEIISLEMLDVMIPESAVERIIVSKLLSQDHSCFLDDPQLVKRILNQLKELGLIKSNFDNGRSILYWGVTAKGAKTRSDKTISKKSS